MGLRADLPAYENRTGGGGRHLYFDRHGAFIRTSKSFRPGIDIIADSGYVIAAGSAGIASNYTCVNDVDPAPIPHWLRAELLKGPSIDSVQPTTEEVDWVATALLGVPEGERNCTAARLAGHFLGRGESQEVVEILLCAFVGRCGGPLMPESEVRATVKSIARAEALKREGSLMEISEPWPVFAQRVAAQPKRQMLIENLIPEGIGLFHGQPRAGSRPPFSNVCSPLRPARQHLVSMPSRRAILCPRDITEEDPNRKSGNASTAASRQGMSRQPELLDFSVWRDVSRRFGVAVADYRNRETAQYSTRGHRSFALRNNEHRPRSSRIRCCRAVSATSAARDELPIDLACSSRHQTIKNWPRVASASSPRQWRRDPRILRLLDPLRAPQRQ